MYLLACMYFWFFFFFSNVTYESILNTSIYYYCTESISMYSLASPSSCPSSSGTDPLWLACFHLWTGYPDNPLWKHVLSASQLSALAFSILFTKEWSSRLFSKSALPHLSWIFLNKPSGSSQWKQDTSTSSLKGGGKLTPTPKQNC